MKAKQTYISLTALLIAALTVIPGCRGGTGSSSQTSGGSSSDIQSEERLFPDLPDVTYDGYEFTFDQWDIDGWGMMQDIFAEASDESKVGSAVYRRNKTVEEKYKVTITQMSEDINTIQQTYIHQVGSADQDVDVFLVRSHEMQFVLPNDLCLELGQLEYCDFTKPWWDRNSVSQFSIGHKLYMIGSDITLRDKNATACVMFNKQVQENYQVGDIYSLVDSNEWTWDRMIELAKKATHDNGDSVWDENDTWGWVSLDDLTYIMLHGGGARYATKDSDDLPIPGFRETRTLEVAQKVQDIIFNDQYFFHLAKAGNSNVGDIFSANRALFYTDAIFRAQGLSDMEADFGIMPVPKYDESQKEYGHSVSIHFSSALSVPKTNNNLSRTSVVLEALAAESKYTVIPEYYDIYVKVRNTRDEEAKAMLDLIFASRVYDLGEFFQFGAFNSAFLRMWTNKTNENVATLYQQYDSKVTAAISQFIEKVVKE